MYKFCTFVWWKKMKTDIKVIDVVCVRLLHLATTGLCKYSRNILLTKRSEHHLLAYVRKKTTFSRCNRCSVCKTKETIVALF